MVAAPQVVVSVVLVIGAALLGYLAEPHARGQHFYCG